MYERARALNCPFMAGSSAPLFWRNPPLELQPESPLQEALCMSFGSLEGYGYHGLECLQTFVEKRRGGETGVAGVTIAVGETVILLHPPPPLVDVSIAMERGVSAE